MTDTAYTSRLLGSAWPGYFNKPIAEDDVREHQESRPAAMVGRRSDTREGVSARTESAGARPGDEDSAECAPAASGDIDGGEEGSARQQPMGGGSDDIGDVSWVVPTVTLRYPSNIPGGPGHNWANGISMATPIAHKGVIAGAKVQAMTMLDILLHPELVQKAWDYFKNVQTKDVKYTSLPASRRQAGHLAEREDHGAVSATG